MAIDHKHQEVYALGLREQHFPLIGRVFHFMFACLVPPGLSIVKCYQLEDVITMGLSKCCLVLSIKEVHSSTDFLTGIWGNLKYPCRGLTHH